MTKLFGWLGSPDGLKEAVLALYSSVLGATPSWQGGVYTWTLPDG